VTGLGKSGYPDVNLRISNGPACLKCTGPCLLDGFEDIWGCLASGDLPAIISNYRPVTSGTLLVSTSAFGRPSFCVYSFIMPRIRYLA
jgi:hypothetical protein